MALRIQEEILSFFPFSIFSQNQFHIEDKLTQVEEVRIRLAKPIFLCFANQDMLVNHLTTEAEMTRILENFCHRSIYASQAEINQGYMTLKGGHRVGICGTCVFENETIKNIKNISSLNVRIAREVKECSHPVLTHIVKHHGFQNTLILSPPGCGKTTLLRDMIRNLSNGFDSMQGQNISLVDERSEVAAMYKGIPQNDVGERTDVICNVPKWLGIKMMIRSMGPNIIATDEIGLKKEWEAVEEAVCSGVKLLLTSHGNSLWDIPKEIIEKQYFQYIVILEKKERPGMVSKIYHWEDNHYVLFD